MRRLQHHGSLVLWAGNNENEAGLLNNWYNTFPDLERYKTDYIKLYVDTIKATATKEDFVGYRPFIVRKKNGILQMQIMQIVCIR